MTIAIPGSITGAAQTGFTSPGYTMTADAAPDQFSKKAVVSAITGTQTGVRTHTGSDPFTLTYFRPRQFTPLPKANPITGLYPSIPKMRWKSVTQKGTIYAVGQPAAVSYARTEYEVVAGADTADPANVRAMVALHSGANFTLASGMGDSLVTGIFG